MQVVEARMETQRADAPMGVYGPEEIDYRRPSLERLVTTKQLFTVYRDVPVITSHQI